MKDHNAKSALVGLLAMLGIAGVLVLLMVAAMVMGLANPIFEG